jgi:GNAT superfamily N-acetyltransferase
VLSIRQASVLDIELVVPLFDAYRQFYGQTSNVALARSFLSERFAHHESVVFLALNSNAAVGFTQLYPSFSSASAARTYILNDLFVHPPYRRSGVAKLLLAEAVRHAQVLGAVRLTLSTAHTNVPAQKLYESLGWKADEQFRSYVLAIGAPHRA